MPFSLNAMGAFAALVVGALLLDGCGGGGDTPVNSITVPRGTKLTAANVSNFSSDAVVLEERLSTEPFLSAYDAAVFDADLALIRKSHPELAGIHAFPNYVDREMLVGVFSGGSQLAQEWFNQGLPSTEGPLRDVLTTYGAQDVQYQGLADFKVTFSGPINIPVVAKLMLQASQDIRYAEPNGYGGDGDNIVFTPGADARTYAFSHGWGDCSAGCILRHTWTVVVGTRIISFEESGTPIPPDGGKAVNAGRTTKANSLSSK